MDVKHLKIAICGHTAPGKRMICNGLVGKEIIQGGLEAHSTTCCKTYETSDMEITICDVQGFDDSLMNVAADQYITEIKDHCLDADLLLYCIELEETNEKFLSDSEIFLNDEKSLNQLKKCFDSSSVWAHCIFILIFPQPIFLKGDTEKRSTRDKHIKDKEI